MKRMLRTNLVLLTAAATFFTGCGPARPLYLFDNGQLTTYKGAATEIEYPDVNQIPLQEVTEAHAPLTVANNEPCEFWDLTLEETIKNALANGKVLRQLGGQLSSNFSVQGNGFLGAGSQLTSAPGAAATVFNPALIDSNPQTGTEAALAAFDAQYSSYAVATHVDDPRNVNLAGIGGAFFRQADRQDRLAYVNHISKISAAGTRYGIGHGFNYDWNNSPTNGVPSVWRTQVDAYVAHPLLRFGGVDYNRIAGPALLSNPSFFLERGNDINGNLGGGSGFNQIGQYRGVLLSRIDFDISLADFEVGVRNVVSDTENAYWTLFFAYRNLDANVAGRDSSLQTWRKVHAMAQAGAADAAQEAQAREQYFLFRGQVESALSDLYTAENRLRYMMGLAATDCRLIRPSDNPTTAKVVFDWQQSHEEALARSAELRRQRWTIKRRELELVASKNYLLPRLDLTAQYRLKGLGDQLVSANGGQPPFQNAYGTMFSGDFQEWNAGLELNMPIGLRRELTAVRNAQLNLVRERAILEDQELEISHQLAEAIRSLDRQYMLSQTNFNRRAAAKRQVEAVQQNYEVGRITLDQLLDAQRRLADAEARYFDSLSSYNRAITAVHLRKGSLLEYNAVYLAEGPWASKAYFDAEERARKRDAGKFIDYGFTRPSVFSQGPIDQGSFSGEYVNEQYYEEVDGARPDAISAEPTMPQTPTIAPEQPGPRQPEPPLPQQGEPLKLETPTIPLPTPAPLDAPKLPTIQQPAPAPKATPMSRPTGQTTGYDDARSEGNSRSTIRAVGYAAR